MGWEAGLRCHEAGWKGSRASLWAHPASLDSLLPLTTSAASVRGRTLTAEVRALENTELPPNLPRHACLLLMCLLSGRALHLVLLTPFNPQLLLPPPPQLPLIVVAAAAAAHCGRRRLADLRNPQSATASASMDQVKAKLENAKEALFGQASWVVGQHCWCTLAVPRQRPV